MGIKEIQMERYEGNMDSELNKGGELNVQEE